jgi:hypothetical protein
MNRDHTARARALGITLAALLMTACADSSSPEGTEQGQAEQTCSWDESRWDECEWG